MARFHLNPTFDIESGALIAHDGLFHVEHFAIRCDRGAAAQAKTQGQQAGSTATTAGSNASADRAAIIPGLVNDANNPNGFTPVQKNNLLVGSQEAVGGANSGITGEANLATARTRNSGGFAAALDEAARQKGRQLSSNSLQVNNADAQLAEQKQQQARAALQGLYGTDTSHQLQAMGLQGQDLQDQLQAGRQGWLQNTTGVITALGSLGGGVGAAAKGFQ